jgi:hypothetical protein
MENVLVWVRLAKNSISFRLAVVFASTRNDITCRKTLGIS